MNEANERRIEMVKKTDRKMERNRRHLRVRTKYLEQQKDQDYVYIEAIQIYMYKL